MSVQTGSVFRAKRTGRATKGGETAGSDCGASAVVASNKASFNPPPSSPLGGPRKERRYDKNPAGGGSRQTP